MAAGILLLVFLLDVVLFLLKPFGDNFYIVANFTTVLFSLLAAVFGFYAYKSHQFSDVQGRALFFLTAGIFLWFLSEFTWAVYEAATGFVPVVSIGDFFWYAGYAMFLTGLYYIWKLALWPINRKWFILCAGVLLVVSYLIWSVSVPILADSELSTIDKVASAGYALGDMLVLDALIVIAFYLSRNKLSKAWLLVVLAMSLTTLADVLYAKEFLLYETGSPLDLLWGLSYITFALAFLYYRTKWRKVLAQTKA